MFVVKHKKQITSLQGEAHPLLGLVSVLLVSIAIILKSALERLLESLSLN